MAINMQPVISSNVSRVGYDDEKGEILVQFQNGATYAYTGADRDTYEQLLAADSPGKFVNDNLKNSYSTRRV